MTLSGTLTVAQRYAALKLASEALKHSKVTGRERCDKARQRMANTSTLPGTIFARAPATAGSYLAAIG